MLKLQFRDQPGSSIKLSALTVTLGRDESNDVVIDSQSVSDFHAEISTDAQFPVIIDNMMNRHQQHVLGRAPADQLPPNQRRLRQVKGLLRLLQQDGLERSRR